MTIMLDSTSPDAIINAVRRNATVDFQHVVAAALYADGNYAAPPAAFSVLHRLGVKTVDITVKGNPGIKAGKVAADDESGDLTPEQAATWAEAENHAGEWPVIYVNRSNKPDTIALCTKLGLEPVRDFGLWAATLDGTFTDTGGADLRGEPGVVAVQAWPAAMVGFDADASVLTRLGHEWLGIPPTWDVHAIELLDQLRHLIKAHA